MIIIFALVLRLILAGLRTKAMYLTEKKGEQC